MSFSVTNKRINYEWAGKNLKTIFDYKNIFTFRYLKVLKDIFKFSKLCEKNVSLYNIDLKKFLKNYDFSKEFIDLYFLPMCASIWSSDLKNLMNYNTSFILNFFKNHGLNNIISKRPVWFTIKNGSKTYIEKIIIFANHTDQIKKILKKANKKQLELLNSVKYQKNKVIIHTDKNLMPKKQSNWSSWNYLYNRDNLILTYWMNLLQKLKCKRNIFVTLNFDKIKKKSIIKKIIYEHPVFTKPLKSINKINQKAQGLNNIWFAGAWLGYGFHEDGVKSALKIRKLINAK